MGSSNSKESAEKRMSGAALEEKRRKALARHGVLIPPAFGVTGTPSEKGTGPPLSIQHRLLETAANANEPVSYFAYLHHTDLGTCIIQDHLQPGIWIATQASNLTMVRASVTPGNSLPISNSQLFVERKIADHTGKKVRGVVQLRAETREGSLPSISGSWQMSKHGALFANLNTSTTGWIGGHFDRTFLIEQIQEKLPPSMLLYGSPEEEEEDDVYQNDPFQTAAQVKPYEGLDTMSRQTVNVKLGSWLPINFKSFMRNKSFLGSGKQRVQGYAAVNMLGATAAIHGSMPMDGSFQLPVVNSYFSANLNDIDRPPLQITVERDNDKDMATISLNQVLAFDRWQWNPLEGRAPKIRNTAAWTIQMQSRAGGEKTAEIAVLSEDSGAHQQQQDSRRTNHVAFGAAWQINRGLAVKAVLRPQEQTLSTAVIFKRWKHPRIACSILNSFSSSGTNGYYSFCGVGIELETGQFSSNPAAYYYNHHPSSATTIVDSNSVPQTKAALPSELFDKV